MQQLKGLSTEEITQTLLSIKKVTMDDLKALPLSIGIVTQDQRINRQELVDRSVKLGFANARGYDLLRSGK